MTQKTFIQIRIYFIGIITIGIWSLLLWNHFHDGVLSHHILHREDLPSISNWWGGLLLPLLTLFLTYQIQKRIFNQNNDSKIQPSILRPVILGFFSALLFGLMLALFFTQWNPNVSGYMMYSLFLLALFFPIYRAECLLGFVIGMTYSIGVVLPTIAGSVLALIVFIIYKYVRTVILFIIRKIIK